MIQRLLVYYVLNQNKIYLKKKHFSLLNKFIYLGNFVLSSPIFNANRFSVTNWIY